MTLLEELKLFIKSILHWIYALIGFSFFFFLFGLRTVTVFGREVTVPFVNEHSFAVQFFKMIQRDVLPPNVDLIATNPMSGFITQLEVAIALAFIALFPFFLYRIMRYISPALFEHEKRAIIKSLVLSTILFALGCLFAYLYLIPLTFKFMYPFTTVLGVVPFFAVDAFIVWVIGMLLATGTAFLLPVLMVMLSSLGIVSPDFWKSKWRHAFAFLLIFSAVITPDQTGATMGLLFVPLAVLYATGSLLAGKSVEGR